MQREAFVDISAGKPRPKAICLRYYAGRGYVPSDFLATMMRKPAEDGIDVFDSNTKHGELPCLHRECLEHYGIDCS